MIPKELLKKIRQIEIRTRRLVADSLAGQYHSAFKGVGMDFDEVREYQPGDEVRTIDWNVTARMNHPFVKKFREERELTVMVMVDVPPLLNTSVPFPSAASTDAFETVTFPVPIFLPLKVMVSTLPEFANAFGVPPL
jgi:uncharacterized protein (DUF58 family)